MKTLKDNSIDSIVADPPYGLSKEPKIEEVLSHWLAGSEYQHGSKGFMGKSWDSFVPNPDVWKECFRVLKPGGHILCFAGTRTQDLMGISLRLGGFEIRDQIQWVYGSGFPKSLDVSKAIGKSLGIEREVLDTQVRKSGEMAHIMKTNSEQGYRPEDYYKDFGNILKITKPESEEAKQWEGWGTSLKPATEPIILARKPFKTTVANNVLEWGTGAINIDGCRVCPSEGSLGRWPANFIHDGSDEVLELFPQTGTNKKGGKPYSYQGKEYNNSKTSMFNGDKPQAFSNYNDFGSAARFFYCTKASKKERTCNGKVVNNHPTVKPLALVEYLVRLITPPGGIVLDPFAGSGTTGIAALKEGFQYVLIEFEEESYNICCERINSFL